MTDRPSPLRTLLEVLWAEARLWPPSAAARLPEVRALALHRGLPCPDREHALLVPSAGLITRYLDRSGPEITAHFAADFSWLVTLLADHVDRP